MKTMIISEFKAKCIATVKQVQRRGEPLVLTIRGKPVVEIRPVSVEGTARRLGAHAGMSLVSDVPIHEDWDDEWEMASDTGRVLDPAAR